MTGFEQPGPRADLNWAAIDLDDTLAESKWTPENPTSEIGLPIAENVAKVVALVAAGWTCVIWTARPWSDDEAIKAWLRYWNVPIDRVVCGKLLAAFYVDDRGFHESAKSWLPEDALPGHRVKQFCGELGVGDRHV